MPLVSQSIKNLKGGVSQQPDILRYPEQGAKQVNGWSSETEGLQKRPPSVFIKLLEDKGALGDYPLIHLINRDEQERYYVCFTGNGIKVFDLEGNTYRVRGNMDYVTSWNPRIELRLITVADYTFIVNKMKTVRANLDYDYTIWENREGLITIRGGQYGRTFTITINNYSVSYNLPSGIGKDYEESASMVKETDAQWLVNKMVELLRDKFRDSPGWYFTPGAGFIHIISPAWEPINKLETEDGYGGTLMTSVMHDAQSFAKLPLEAPNGYAIRIIGDSSRTADAFYVHYDAVKKVWKETVGWGVPKGFNSSTMPHALIRKEDGSFELSELDWDIRKCGDLLTNPDPSFVGNTINDVFFFRNRLGFLSGENIILSRTSKYFNFFPASVANLSDDDPIDVAVAHNRISTLKYAVPFTEELLLWADQAQFVLKANGILTGKSVELNLTTEFYVSDEARPYGIGRGVFFAAPRASFTSIHRYYAVQDTSYVKNAADISSHIPQYIPNGVFSIKGSGTENFLTVLTSKESSKIFLYKFLYQEEELIQQSWSHWDMGTGVSVLACDCIGSTMYLMLQNERYIWLSQLSFTKDTLDFGGEPYRLVMDHKVRYTIPQGTYDNDRYLTTFKISDIYKMLIYGTRDIYIVSQNGIIDIREAPEGGWNGSTVWADLEGNREGEEIFIGFSIPFEYEFSKFLIKKTSDDGSIETEDIGRLQLRRAWVNYEESGPLTITVNNGSSNVFRYIMSGARLGSEQLTLGNININTGQFRFPMAGNAVKNKVTLTSNEPTPLSIIGAGWEGNYIRRSTGI